MLKLILPLFFIIINVNAFEPISSIPIEDIVDIKKALLGKELFFDTLLSKDNSTACLSCHDVFNGGADSKIVSVGFENKKGNIQSPTVLNAKYNFRQFWNGRAANLLEQADGPMNNPVEHNMNPKAIEERLNNSVKYKKEFNEVYGVSRIKYELVLDAIVEFENSLTTPNSKFDKFLRHEIELSPDEKEGYTLFKQFGCITCHNGVNIGANSFQKMGTFLEYKSEGTYPDRFVITKKESHKNVFKVPTLRNITLTAPYFHDGSAATLKEALESMSKYNLGQTFSNEEIEKIISFLETLKGETPKILEEF
ncbi:MAG: cytochrome c peroxidase [Sulfurimonas sp.]|jgi:cytochrome c peroxidase